MLDPAKVSVGDPFKIGRRSYVVHTVMLEPGGGEIVFHSLALLHHRVLRVVGGQWEMMTAARNVIAKGLLK